jgi:hypothetical protein
MYGYNDTRSATRFVGRCAAYYYKAIQVERTQPCTRDNAAMNEKYTEENMV